MVKLDTFVLVLCIAVIVDTCFSQPSKDIPVSGNLRLDFGSQDEIPSAFFDAPTASNSRAPTQRKSYPPCQDGSGGICVEEGQCPPNLKPERNNTAACGPGLECCFGPAENDKSCGSRGGECLSRTVCGGRPIFKEAVDCDTTKGEVCCIHI